MKKRGFTLIELLAVIVVLSIIALIATPIVMNTIENVKKGAAEISAQNYIKAVDTTIATSVINKKKVSDGTYSINGEGNLTGAGLPDGQLVIEANGNRPTSGTVTIVDGSVSTSKKLKIGNYVVNYDTTKKTYVATKENDSKESVAGMHLVVDGDSLNAIRNGDNNENVDDVNWHTKVAKALNLKYETYTNSDGEVWYKDVYALVWSMVSKNDTYINSGKPKNLSSDDRVNALVDRIKEIEANGEKVLLIINGGTNDVLQTGIEDGDKTPFGTIDSAHDETTYYGALQLWFDKLQEKVPNAKIVFLGAPYEASVEGWALRYDDITTLVDFFPQVRIAQKAVCEKYGIQYIDLYNEVGANENTDYVDDSTWEQVREYLNKDGTHYNTIKGSDAIANVIINNLK